MDAQIFVNCGNDWFGFSVSKTGQLDYCGKMDKAAKVEGFQRLESSAYFSPCRYVFLQDGLNVCPKVYVDPEIDVSDGNVFSYLVHVGALLAAVEAKDSLLAGELYLRRRMVFDQFAQLSSYIMEPLCVEILFSLCFGKMRNVDENSISLIFNNAKKKLGFDSAKESLGQAFKRYFRENSVEMTLPLVGTNFYSWDLEPRVLWKLTDGLGDEGLVVRSERIRKDKHNLYAELKCSVQAEPYNRYDKNSILVCMENIEAKICGNPGLEKVGHIRALAAEVIREAKPELLNYGGSLVRLGYDEIVVKVRV